MTKRMKHGLWAIAAIFLVMCGVLAVIQNTHEGAQLLGSIGWMVIGGLAIWKVAKWADSK